MTLPFDRFERLVRSVGGELTHLQRGAAQGSEQDELHPFETRNIHPDFPKKVRTLFDDSHYEQAVFEAFKFIESEVKRLSGLRERRGMG